HYGSPMLARTHSVRGPRLRRPLVLKWRAMRALPLCLVAAAGLGAPAHADEPALVQFDRDYDGARWRTDATKDGPVRERRRVAGSPFYEYRAVVGVQLDPSLVADEIWRSFHEGDQENLRRRDVLRESSDELLVYDQIHTPVVSDRDYTMMVKRVFDPARKRT